MELCSIGNQAVGAVISVDLDNDFVNLIDSIPDKIRKIDGIYNVDPFKFRKDFLDSMENVADNSVDPNANMDGKSPVSLTAEMFKPLQKIDSLHVLWKHMLKKYGRIVADKSVMDMSDGLLYFHDSTKTHIPYCVAVSSYGILTDGLPFGARPKPPKRADSYTNQTIEFIMQMAQEVAGAVAIPDYFVNYAWFSKRENKDEYGIKQDQERLVFTVNNNFRIGGDSPFTNLPIFDKTTFTKLFGELYFPDGTAAVDYWDEVERVQDIFCRWFSKGHNGVPHKFPVVTVNISADENGNVIHEDFLERLMVYNKDLCCFNFYKGEKLAMCCRFTNDLGEMRDTIRFNSGFGNGGLNIGSHRVVAINLHRVALDAKYTNGRGFYERLEDAMYMAARLLDVHRNSILKRRIDQGFLRFFRVGWLHINMFFSTIGMIGLSDAVKVMTGKEIHEYEGLEFAKGIEEYMDKMAGKYSKEFDCVFNVEECPAEGAAVKLAEKNKFYFSEYLDSAFLPNLLANQTVPLESNINIIERAKIMGELMTMSGGSIAHFNIVDENPDPHSLFLFAKRLMCDCKIPHFAFNKAISICSENDDHIMYGPHDKCIICGADIGDIVTRVVGYFVPVSKWGKPRRTGFKNRKFYFLNGADHDSEASKITIPESLG
jgi:anaerobic ribonucleoside-triphosphate reductase